MISIALAQTIVLLHAQGLPIYLDANRNPTVRAQDLVARLTVPEKIAQCMMETPSVPRLHIPSYHYWSEGLHGIANNGVATVFPQAIGMASTWDPQLIYRVAEVIGTEARGKYATSGTPDHHAIFQGITIWSPNINIFRDPRWGRGQETYGEDPLLTSKMGVAFVSGLQGDDPKYLRVVATPKHFAVHSGPEPLRHGFDAKVTEKELRETYLPAFEACVKQANAASIMSAYSGFNGVPDTGSPWLLTTLLRKEWGFNGAVVSDVDSVGDLWYGHHAAKDRAEASAMAIKAGDDLCSGTTYQGLGEALKRGLIQESDIDRAVTRLFTLRFRLGMFDGPDQCRYQKIGKKDIDTPANEKLALKTAEKSLVLLKNDGLLPLNTKKLKRVAILGPSAENLSVLEGNYNGTPGRPSLLRQAITERLKKSGIAVDYDLGTPFTKTMVAVRDFPAGVLFTDSRRATPGLKGEVFGNIKFEGDPIAERVDQGFNFHWGNGVPYGNIPGNNCSVRWSGVLIWPKNETVDLKVSADDGVRLYLNDQMVVNEWRDQPESPFGASYHFKAGVPVNVRIEYYQAAGEAAFRFGYSKPAGDPSEFSRAVELAKKADVTILALGINADLESEESSRHEEGFQGGDRTSIELPQPQLRLLKQITALSKPVVLLTTSGSCLSVPMQGVNSWLQCWYPGEQGGQAVAKAIFGDVNPSGHLPVTFYRSTSDLPAFTNYHLTGRTYRFFGGKPLFPFGYGLSYSKFEYGKASVKVAAGKRWVIVPVKNTSKVSGDEVVQVYARYGHPNASDPIRRLVGFQRVSIPVGKTVQVSIPISNWDLRSWNENHHAYEVRPGNYIFEVGPAAGAVSTSVRVTA